MACSSKFLVKEMKHQVRVYLGDMIVQISVKDHPTLKREGNNLHFDLYISLSEAVLGTYKGN
jgi:DnaJ-class molecular chaperone